jgi:hypothetical protein
MVADEVAPPMTQGEVLKRCPECAEAIRAEAFVCRYCGFDFRTGTISPRRRRRLRATPALAGTLALVGGGLFLIGSLFAGGGLDGLPTDFAVAKLLREAPPALLLGIGGWLAFAWQDRLPLAAGMTLTAGLVAACLVVGSMLVATSGWSYVQLAGAAAGAVGGVLLVRVASDRLR